MREGIASLKHSELEREKTVFAYLDFPFGGKVSHDIRGFPEGEKFMKGSRLTQKKVGLEYA